MGIAFATEWRLPTEEESGPIRRRHVPLLEGLPRPTIHGARIGSASQVTRNAQARRDARG